MYHFDGSSALSFDKTDMIDLFWRSTCPFDLGSPVVLSIRIKSAIFSVRPFFFIFKLMFAGTPIIFCASDK